jgi:hypothetical protein
MCHFEYSKKFANERLSHLDQGVLAAMVKQDDQPIYWGRFQGITTDPNAPHGVAEYPFVITCFVYGLQDDTSRLNAALWLAHSAVMFKTKLLLIGDISVLIGKVNQDWVTLHQISWVNLSDSACKLLQQHALTTNSELKLNKPNSCGVLRAANPVYKANDLLPLVSTLFPNLVDGYTFWGYTVLGSMIGNLRVFMTDVVVKHADVVTTGNRSHKQ